MELTLNELVEYLDQGKPVSCTFDQIVSAFFLFYEDNREKHGQPFINPILYGRKAVLMAGIRLWCRINRVYHSYGPDETFIFKKMEDEKDKN